MKNLKAIQPLRRLYGDLPGNGRDRLPSDIDIAGELQRSIQRYIEKSEERYRTLFDLLPAAVYACDAKGLILEFNRHAVSLWGREPATRDPGERYCGSSRIRYPDGRLMPPKAYPMARVLRGETLRPSECEIVIERRDGSRRNVAANPTAFKNANGKITGAINCLFDITERKQTERALELASRLPRENPAPVMRLDRSGSIRFANSPALEILKSAGAGVGAQAPDEILEMTRRQKRCKAELTYFGRTYLVSCVPVNEGNQINFYFSDITDRKATEAMLAKAAVQQTALYKFVQRRHDAKTLSEIYSAALDAILTALPCDRAAVLLFDESNTMRFVASRGLSSGYRRTVEGHCPWKPGQTKPKPVCLHDISKAKIPTALRKTILKEGIHAAAFVPLIGEGKVIGKFMIYYDEPHRFNEEEMTLSLNIAGQLALAIIRMRAEAALVESEKMHRAFFSQTDVGMIRSDLAGRILSANKKICDIVGYRASELIGQTIYQLNHPSYRATTRRKFREMVKKGTSYHFEKQYVRKDGSPVWVNVTASAICDARGKAQAAVAVIRDITERKEAQKKLEAAKLSLESRVRARTRELLASNTQLQREILRRKGTEGEILEISEREQRRIGQELHDSVCQHLTAIAFMARSMAQRLRNHRVIGVEDIERIAELINQGVTETRTIARGLHPVEMNPDGFAAALQSLLHHRSQIPFRFDIDEKVSITDPAVALHLYRIASEAVMNANKHSRASLVAVQVLNSGKQIELSVTDDGVGVGRRSGEKTGMGFHVMKYRARSIGARLEISPVKPRGTRVACYLPVL